MGTKKVFITIVTGFRLYCRELTMWTLVLVFKSTYNMSGLHACVNDATINGTSGLYTRKRSNGVLNAQAIKR